MLLHHLARISVSTLVIYLAVPILNVMNLIYVVQINT